MLDDAARPLTKRGRRAARRIAAEMVRRSWMPDLILCSTAKRARQTLKQVCKGLNEAGATAPEVIYEDGLYLAGARNLLERARAFNDGLSSVLFLGHNPGLGDFMRLLSDSGGDGGGSGDHGFPTCALACLDLDCQGWAGLTPGTGRLTSLLRPRELA